METISEGLETPCPLFRKRMEVAWSKSNKNILFRLPPGHLGQLAKTH